MGFISALKKIWCFIWYEDSLASWTVNLILAFILVKFVIYPGFGFLLSTNYPIVAVVSSSMEHNGLNFEEWWNKNKNWYEDNNIRKEDFKSFRNGFNKGDIMVLKGVEPKDIKTADVVVYENPAYRNPIIHRIVEINQEDGKYYFIAKGDNNFSPDNYPVTEKQIERTGKAVIRIPLLGWIKIWFVSLFGFG